MKPLGILLTVAMLLLLVVAPASADPPPTSGIVVRYETEGWWYQCTADSGFCVVYGWNPGDACTSPDPEIDVVSVQDITLPQYEDVVRMLRHIHGTDMNTYVFPYEVFPCPTSADIVASGLARFNYTDNDVYAWLTNRHNANAYGWTANGEVYASDGTRMRLNGIVKNTWKPDGSVLNQINKVHLH